VATVFVRCGNALEEGRGYLKGEKEKREELEAKLAQLR